MGFAVIFPLALLLTFCTLALVTILSSDLRVEWQAVVSAFLGVLGFWVVVLVIVDLIVNGLN